MFKESFQTPSNNTFDLLANPEECRIFHEYRDKFQPYTIKLPELPILDTSSMPIVPSQIPVLGAKYGESKNAGFDFIILTPWAKHIHDEYFLFRFLLLEIGYKHGNIHSVREVSNRIAQPFSDIKKLASELIKLKANRRNKLMSPEEMVTHLSKILTKQNILIKPFTSKSILSPEEIRYFQDARRIQGEDYQRLLAIHQLFSLFRTEDT